MTQENNVVHTVEKGLGEQIQFSIRRYKGKYFADIRLWYNGTSDMVMLPTKKGVAFSIDKLEEMKVGIEKLIEQAKLVKETK